MARPAEMRNRVARNINFENEEFLEFERFVGRDNVSKEIRALVKNFVEDQKKGEASSDPLNQVRLIQQTNYSTSLTGVNTTLDIYILSKKEIREYIGRIEDVRTLAQIEENGKCFWKIARTKKLEVIPVEKLRNELK